MKRAARVRRGDQRRAAPDATARDERGARRRVRVRLVRRDRAAGTGAGTGAESARWAARGPHPNRARGGIRARAADGEHGGFVRGDGDGA